MKKFSALLLFSVLSLACIPSFGQADSHAFQYADFTWFGLDFSEARLIGSEGFTNPQDLKGRFLNAWNNLIINENEKYDLGEYYNMPWKESNLAIVKKRNAAIDANVLVIDEPYTLDADRIVTIISEYPTDSISDGLGLVYVIESFDKAEVMSQMYVVFFQIATKEVLWQQKYSATPGGFGVRNYWASSVLGVIKKSGEQFSAAKKKAKK